MCNVSLDMALELPFARHFSANAADVKVDRDDQVLESYKRSFQIDREVASADVLRAELSHVRTDVENLTVYSQELTAINGDHAEAKTNTFEPEIETFRREVQRGRFSDQTLHILESLLVCKDVKSLMETRSRLTEFMRSEFLSVMRDIKEKTVEQKLWILEFFVHTFALLGDIEGCLALKYESLLLREVKSSDCQFLQVSCMEWLNFAEHLLDNGFYPIARQACENALLHIKKDDVGNAKKGEFSGNKRIKRLRDHAVICAASGSVQAQATEYLKRKTIEKSNISSPISKEAQCMASSLFRNGIKKRNVRQLLESQRTRVPEIFKFTAP